MRTDNLNTKAMYEKLHTLLSRHPGPIDQYSDLRKMLRKAGFTSDITFRGKDFELSNVAGRYEVWIKYPGSNSKAGKGNSLGEAVKDAVRHCHTMYSLYTEKATS